MPRGRGGRRAGVIGKAYPNRTDLNGAQPIASGPATQYGERKALEDAQRVIPLPNRPAVPASPEQTSTPAGTVPPGSFGAFDRPTERPAEPLTTGIASGPGAGPEVLGLPPDLSSLSTLLRTVADRANESDLHFLADQAQNMGL